MAISKKFSDFLNEASLKGNIGVPGEGGTEGSWIESINRDQREKVREFERTNMNLLRNFGGIIEDSKRLQRGKEKELEATGGSSWRKYLHPKYQRRIFYPYLWSDEELKNWGT